MPRVVTISIGSIGVDRRSSISIGSRSSISIGSIGVDSRSSISRFLEGIYLGNIDGRNMPSIKRISVVIVEVRLDIIGLSIGLGNILATISASSVGGHNLIVVRPLGLVEVAEQVPGGRVGGPQPRGSTQTRGYIIPGINTKSQKGEKEKLHDWLE